MGPLVQTAVFGVLLPGGVAALAALLARPWRRRERSGAAALIPGPAIFVAYALAHRQLSGELQLAPLEVWDWLPHIALLAAAAGLAGGSGRGSLSWAARAVASLTAAYLLLEPQFEHQLAGAAGPAAVLGAAATLLLYWAALERAVSREESPRVGAGLLLVIPGAAAGVAAASGTLLVGQLGGAAAAAIGGVLVVSLAFPNASMVRAAVASTAVLSWAAIVLAFFYAFMHPPVLVELLLLPVVVLVVQAAVRSRRKLRVAALLGSAVAMAGLAAATALVLDETASGPADAEADSGSANDYGYR